MKKIECDVCGRKFDLKDPTDCRYILNYGKCYSCFQKCILAIADEYARVMSEQTRILNKLNKQMSDLELRIRAGFYTPPICQECGRDLGEREADECGDLCYICYSQVDIEDYRPSHPDDPTGGRRGI